MPDEIDIEPNNNTEQTQEGLKFGEVYEQGVKEIHGLPLLGKIVLGGALLLVLFKLTPILDLLWIFIQLIVLPCLLLISLGLMSHSTYLLFIGWMNDAIVWTRSNKHLMSGKRESES